MKEVKLALLAWVVGLGVSACNPPNIAGPALKPETTKDAFKNGPVQCSAIRPKTEPGLMAWEPGERANLNEIRQQGLVVVRYKAEGCDVELQVLSNCIAPGSYKYYPYNSSNSIVINNANELYNELPLGAARLEAKLHGDRGLRTDYELVGIDAIQAGTVVRKSDLRGECQGATHVISKIYVGGFALDSGEKRSLDAAATIFGTGAGAKSIASAVHLQSEGDPAACKQAMSDGKPEVSCSTPLQIALLPLDSASAVSSNTPQPSRAAAPDATQEHDSAAAAPAPVPTGSGQRTETWCANGQAGPGNLVCYGGRTVCEAKTRERCAIPSSMPYCWNLYGKCVWENQNVYHCGHNDVVWECAPTRGQCEEERVGQGAPGRCVPARYWPGVCPSTMCRPDLDGSK